MVSPALRQTLEAITAALNAVIRGKPEVVDRLLTGVLAGGHVLIEDVPGVGKTTLAKALAKLTAVTFSRVQFTPDLLPADILGTEILNPSDGTFSFHEGPVFTHVLLADEINRASPRTQSALLEAMNERQVTVEGKSHPLPDPFFVIATQNPIDFEGTYPLPEAQLDRFLLRLELGYPDPEAELAVLKDRRLHDPLDALEPLASGEDLRALQEATRAIHLEDAVARYVLAIAAATRTHPELELGVSTRAALALCRGAQARALIAGRDYVTPDDVQALATAAFAHRVTLRASARYGGVTDRTLVAEIVEQTPVPT